MANHTERIIMETFRQMLEEMPFYKISVSALVKRCNISPNTFYYHYEDIYDLLEKWLAKWLDQFSPHEDWHKNAKEVLYACQENEKLVENVVNYLSREQILSGTTPPEMWIPLLMIWTVISAVLSKQPWKKSRNKFFAQF